MSCVLASKFLILVQHLDVARNYHQLSVCVSGTHHHFGPDVGLIHSKHKCLRHSEGPNFLGESGPAPHPKALEALPT